MSSPVNRDGARLRGRCFRTKRCWLPSQAACPRLRFKVELGIFRGWPSRISQCSPTYRMADRSGSFTMPQREKERLLLFCVAR